MFSSLQMILLPWSRFIRLIVKNELTAKLKKKIRKTDVSKHYRLQKKELKISIAVAQF